MCSKETINKIDRGTHVVIPKWLAFITQIVSPVVLVTTVFVLGAWSNNLDSRTFKDGREKEKVLNFVKAGHPVDIPEATKLLDHIKNDSKHLTLEKLNTIYIPRGELMAILSGISKDIQYQNRLLKAINEKIKK